MTKKKTIFNKIFLLMILLSFIAGGLVLSTAIIKQNSLLKNSLVYEYKMLAGITSQSIESGYLAKKWPFDALKQLSMCENVLFWWVVKPDGEIYLADDAEMWGKKINDSSLGTKEVMVKDSFYPKTNEKIKLIIHPLKIKEEGKPWKFYLGISLKSIAEARNKLLIINIGLFAVIIIFAALLSYYLARTVTEPIKKLTNTVNKISMGDLKIKIDIKSQDEIGELAKAFKRMVNSLKILMKPYKKK